MHKGVLVPVWFFVGLLLAIYGVLIFASGIVEWSRPAKTVLANVHAPVWWGALLAIIGVSYSIAFRPKRR
jgi:FtsH-binding integral membrane protein